MIQRLRHSILPQKVKPFEALLKLPQMVVVLMSLFEKLPQMINSLEVVQKPVSLEK
jgi:hypothetical protein